MPPELSQCRAAAVMQGARSLNPLCCRSRTIDTRCVGCEGFESSPRAAVVAINMPVNDEIATARRMVASMRIISFPWMLQARLDAHRAVALLHVGKGSLPEWGGALIRGHRQSTPAARRRKNGRPLPRTRDGKEPG